ncbi:MAG: NAD-dependent epimerase/dehydratase family protein [Candidatus Paceibacterota bacterium]|jgi:UDP-sulfoquinovose synthase
MGKNIKRLKILVLGADGYLGWPTMQYFKKGGHEVLGVDNLIKREIENQTGNLPLFRKEHKGLEKCDIRDWYFSTLLRDFKPDVIIDYAEIPSAPYSMTRSGAIKTQENNILGTLELLFDIKEYCPNTHLIKLGTMGEYGTPNIDIEEGWINIEHNGRKDRMIYPKKPGSFYHASKVADSVNTEFACRAWGLRATDLNQGVVYGGDDSLHYDEMFGTVINRFIVQAVAGVPLTVYGKGNQTRGFLNISDTLQCVDLAVLNPPKEGEFRVFNQFTEQFSIDELANRIAKIARAKIEHYPNPRIEAEEHYYNAKHSELEKLGLKPHPLTDDVIKGMLALVEKHKDNINIDLINPKTKWL